MSKAKTITLFSFGYYGWGNWTPYLVEAADSIEASRGYEPPIFVDIRIRRSVRAVGFNGTAFEKLLGEDRYRWMKSLGNRQIVSKAGPRIQIDDPKSAYDLLDLAQAAAKDRRRLIYFCNCMWPRLGGKIVCHRTTVGTLVLQAAKKLGISVEVVEWPGGKPSRLTIDVDSKLYRSISAGRIMIPVENDATPAELDGPPWGSIATFRRGQENLHRIVGPAMRHKGGWGLQVLRLFYDPEVGLQKYEDESRKLIKSYGLDSRKSMTR